MVISSVCSNNQQMLTLNEVNLCTRGGRGTRREKWLMSFDDIPACFQFDLRLRREFIASFESKRKEHFFLFLY